MADSLAGHMLEGTAVGAKNFSPLLGRPRRDRPYNFFAIRIRAHAPGLAAKRWGLKTQNPQTEDPTIDCHFALDAAFRVFFPTPNSELTPPPPCNNFSVCTLQPLGILSRVKTKQTAKPQRGHKHAEQTHHRKRQTAEEKSRDD